MSRYHGRRRLIRYQPPHALYATAAWADRRSVEFAAQRESRSKRIRELGRDIAQHVEKIADDEVSSS